MSVNVKFICIVKISICKQSSYVNKTNTMRALYLFHINIKHSFDMCIFNK